MKTVTVNTAFTVTGDLMNFLLGNEDGLTDRAKKDGEAFRDTAESKVKRRFGDVLLSTEWVRDERETVDFVPVDPTDNRILLRCTLSNE